MKLYLINVIRAILIILKSKNLDQALCKIYLILLSTIAHILRQNRIPKLKLSLTFIYITILSKLLKIFQKSHSKSHSNHSPPAPPPNPLTQPAYKPRALFLHKSQESSTLKYMITGEPDRGITSKDLCKMEEQEFGDFEDIEILVQEEVAPLEFCEIIKVLKEEPISRMFCEQMEENKYEEEKDNGIFGVKVCRVDFSDSFDGLIEFMKQVIDFGVMRLVFEECSLPMITEDCCESFEFITPDNKMRPLYGISFDACTFPNPPELKDPSILEKDPKNIDKADQIGLLLNIEGLPSAKYLGEPPSEINGGISSIALKNNGFTEVEMAKLKVYLCYAEHLIIYEEE
ncbi:unnamed protein product [Moneuplotes crassus]|uniref:Uncharacterized protein n=1 Tax=Euplotes crassus TaxID=5936 RepID=A0AAD1XHR1_EUPCR|nr:unnamed protein product [Moneuplotes crassus]